MSVHNGVKTSVDWNVLDLTGTTSAQQEKRWIGDSEGHHCLCVCFCCLQRRPLFFFLPFFFYDAICASSRKACIVCTCKPSREWSLCWGVNNNTIWTSHTAFLSCSLKFSTPLRQGKQERNGHFLAGAIMWKETAPVCCLWWFCGEALSGRPEGESAKVQRIGLRIEPDLWTMTFKCYILTVTRRQRMI